MAYRVKELYWTLQGEGVNVGRAAVFCRFSGCNLWTGREQHRAEAVCGFCDTDFVGTDGPGGGVFPDEGELAAAAARTWAAATGSPPDQDCEGGSRQARALVVCTGGEPLLQLDSALVAAFGEVGFEVAIETNGTIPVPDGVDWVCVSPKAGSDVVVTTGDELKLVYPQQGAEPERFVGAGWAFDHYVLQPMDGPVREANTVAAADYCRRHPLWRLGIQTHKVIGLP